MAIARPCLSDSLASLSFALLGDLLSFCSLAATHPLPLAYFLFFLPHLLRFFSFLSRLLLSTLTLLLALLTIFPYSSAHPPAPDATSSAFGNTLSFLVEMLNPCTDLDPGTCPQGSLLAIALELQACTDSVEAMYREGGAAPNSAGRPQNAGEQEREEEEVEEKRIVSEAIIPSSEIFIWELEAINKLYRALTYEVEEFPIKLALRSLKEGELQPPQGIGFHGGDRKMQTEEAGEDLPRKGPPGFEGRDDDKTPTCGKGEDVSSGNAPESAVKSREGEKRVPPKGQCISRSESDGSRSSKVLRKSSSSSSSAAASMAAGGGLARVASSGEWRGRLSSSGSMRKEGWKRTLACKLYEERMITDGGEEGMDLLWEAYEAGGDSNIGRGNGDHKNGLNGDKGKKEMGKVKEEEAEEEEEEEEMVGRLCCLKALRFSTAKMGFGMERSNVLRVSKAMKGMGVFRRALRRSRKSGE